MDSKFSKKILKAFSLTENLTVIFVMGLIIGITIPNMVKQRNIKNNRIAVRKAISSYNSILRKYMVSSTGIKSVNDLDSVMRDNDCQKLRSNFNVKEVYSNNKCIFTTQDDIVWNLDDPSFAMIGLKGVEYTDISGRGNALKVDNFKVFAIPYDVRCNNDNTCTFGDWQTS